MNMKDFHKWVESVQKTNLEMSDTQRENRHYAQNFEHHKKEVNSNPEMTDTDGEVKSED